MDVSNSFKKFISSRKIFDFSILFILQVRDKEEQLFEVQAVYFHEKFNVDAYLNHDIALLKLKPNSNTQRGVKFGETVVPACLPNSNVVYGTHLDCTVTGWGSMGNRDPGYTRYLQSAQMPIIPIQECIRPQVYGPNKLKEGMFCAGFLDGGIDTCQGDSGGGMVCEVRGRKMVMGLTSWGLGCGRPNRPGVYTKVANYLSWIEDKITL